MKIIILTLLTNCLLGIGLLPSFTENAKPQHPKGAISAVLEAHHAPADVKALSAYICEAVKLTSIDGSADAPGLFERKVLVYRNGEVFKRQKSDPLGLRQQAELTDGKVAYRTTFEKGVRVEKVTSMEAARVQALDFAVNTFGLLPILQQLAEATTEVVYLGRSTHQLEQFKVKTARGSWTLFCDQRHLIRKLQIGDMVIDYADYRTVEGIELPFIQRQSLGNRQLHELIFTRIELNPVFAPDSFAREAL